MMDKNSSCPLTFDITGMHCAACSTRLEKVLSRLPSVEKASVNLATAKANVWPRENAENVEAAIISSTAKAGFSAKIVTTDDSAVQWQERNEKLEKEKKQRLGRLLPMIAFTLPLLLISMGHMMGIPLPGWLEPHENPKAFILAQLFLTLPVVWLGRHFYIEGLAALWRRSPNMDSLVAVGTGAAFLFSVVQTILALAGNDPVERAMNLYYESCAVLLAMIELGQFLEFIAKRKAGDAIGSLMSLTPETALRIEGDCEAPVSVPLAEVKTGDLLVIRPGARIPVDGTVTEGVSAVDLSLLTGESIPVPVERDSELTAGSVNGEGSLIMEATAVGQDTRLARIVRLVRDAQGSKAPIARLADRVSYYFVPAVMLFGLIAALLWLVFAHAALTTALTIFVAVLVMACPCAMGLATPMSIMVGTARGAQLGVLVKNGAALEECGRVNFVCVDKTGTLTTGKPALVSFYRLPDSPVNENILLSMCAALEARSEHPLALAIIKYSAEHGGIPLPVSDVEISPGLGISGRIDWQEKNWNLCIGSSVYMQNINISISREMLDKMNNLADSGQTPLFVALGADGENLRMVALLGLADELRPESKNVIARLRELDIHVAMLTGDNARTAKAIAEKTGIEDFQAGLLPAGKAEYIENLKKAGHIVAMVGDGLNDAPALATANVGLAVGTGVDLSAEAGDIVLVTDGMKAVLTAIRLSRASIRNIRQNLGWAFGYNILGLPIAAGGLAIFGGPLLSPMLAGTAMALSSFSVVSNALRLRWFKSGDR